MLMNSEDIEAEFAIIMASLLVKGEVEYTDDTHALLTDMGWAHWEKLRDSWTREDLQVVYLALGLIIKGHPDVS